MTLILLKIEAKIWQFSSSDDLVITSHNLVICKRFKVSLHYEEHTVMGRKNPEN